MRRVIQLVACCSLLAGPFAFAQETGGGAHPIPIRRDAPEKVHVPQRPEPPPPRDRKPAEASPVGGVVTEPKPVVPPIHPHKSTRPKDPRHPEPPPPAK